MNQELKQFASALEVGHVIAALSLGLKIDYVTLGIDNHHIKLVKSILNSDLDYTELVSYFLASKKAIAVWEMKYVNNQIECGSYQVLKNDHLNSNANYVEKFLLHTIIPDSMKSTISDIGRCKTPC